MCEPCTEECVIPLYYNLGLTSYFLPSLPSAIKTTVVTQLNAGTEEQYLK